MIKHTDDKPVYEEIPDDRLAELMKLYEPVVLRPGQGENKTLWMIHLPDPRKTAYTWDPKPLRRVIKLDTLAIVRSWFPCAYYGFFKPSIAEVLAQVPSGLPDVTNAFWIDADTVAVHKSGEYQSADVHWLAVEDEV